MEFISIVMQNYMWILFGLILILLAIIGYYADKTNFGQGKQEQSKEKEFKFEDKPLSEIFGSSKKEEEKEESKTEIKESTPKEKKEELKEVDVESKEEKEEPEEVLENIIDEGSKTEELEKTEELTNELNKIKNANTKSIKEIEREKEEEYENFEEMFNSYLPEKELIETDILDDLDGLSLDKTQKFNFNSISGLDNIDLPKIKDLSKKEEDIWNRKKK